MKMSIICLILALSAALAERIDHGDNADDTYISYASITAESTKKMIPLYDTDVNFDLEKLDQSNYTVQVCLVYNSSDIDNCTDGRVVATNITDESELRDLIKKAYQKKSETAFIVIAPGEVDVSDDYKTPKFVFTTNITDYFPNNNPDEQYTIYHYFGVNCPAVSSSWTFYCIAMLSWIALVAMWSVSVYWLYKQHVVCIHKIMMFLVVMKCCVDGAYWLRMAICNPMSDPVLLTLAKTSGSTVFQSFSAALLATVALGVSITTDIFARRQFIKVITITLLSYLAHSMYYIFGNSSPFILKLSRAMLVLFSGFMIYNVVVPCVRNIKYLNIEVRSLVNNLELNDIRNGVKKKVWMYVIFMTVAVAYYLFVITEEICLLLVKSSDRTKDYMDGIEALACLFVYLVMLVTFHPCFFTANFRLGQISDGNVYNSVAAQRVANVPFVSITVNESPDAEASKELDPEVIVRLPKECNNESDVVSSLVMASKLS